MKKVLVLAAAMMAAVCSAKAEVSFAYDAGADIVGAYLWRGQYLGGLSFQPNLAVGYDGEKSSLRIGAWGNVGASDYMFKKGLANYIDEAGDEINPNTQFKPEVDIVGQFSALGLSVGFNHYYYCDGSNFFSWKNADLFDENGEVKTTTTTEVWAGYNFGYFFGNKAGAYFNWYTTVAGGDFNYDEATDTYKRAYSSYMEVGYEMCFENVGITLGAQVGMSPWKSEKTYGNEKFAVVNVSAKINKEWELDKVTIDLYAQGSINPNGLVTDKNNPDYNLLLLKAAGDEKSVQKLNGTIGLGFWF